VGERERGTGLVRALHSPRALLLGVAFSFAACCVGGEVVSRHDVFRCFGRFHTQISPESYYYPPLRQVTALARDRAGSGKVLVIVGSNSILHGSGQPEAELWTRHLQEQLGDDYRVVNLAMKGAFPAEFGGVVAEVLSREHERVILITCLGSNGVALGEPEGAAYRYLFWEAYHRGLLRDHPDRERRLQALREKYRDDETFAELQRQMRVDRVTSSRDLWTAAHYHLANTVWSAHVRGSVLRPLKSYPDVDPFSLPALGLHYPAWAERRELGYVRSASGQSPEVLGDPAQWGAALLAAFPEPDRKRTLVVGICDSPYYVDRLEPTEWARYRAIVPSYLPAIERLGFAVLDVSDGWTAADFIDRSHLNAQGGRRLAALVAPKVRLMAEELGYLERGGEP
jgi:hypothetical protein